MDGWLYCRNDPYGEGPPDAVSPATVARTPHSSGQQRIAGLPVALLVGLRRWLRATDGGRHAVADHRRAGQRGRFPGLDLVQPQSAFSRPQPDLAADELGHWRDLRQRVFRRQPALAVSDDGAGGVDVRRLPPGL